MYSPILEKICPPPTPNFLQEKTIQNSYTNKTTKCNCKKSHCMKLYCECYANKELCYNCNCVGCSNTYENLKKKKKSKKLKIKIMLDVTCNCTKSNCRKKYCECFKNGGYCKETCRCMDCKNLKNKKLFNFNKMKVSPVRQEKLFDAFLGRERISVSIVNNKISLSEEKFLN
jgi:hypothetical protein